VFFCTLERFSHGFTRLVSQDLSSHSHARRRGLAVSRVFEKALHEMHLYNGAEYDDQTLYHGPGLNVARVSFDEVEVPSLGSPGHTLELTHYLYSLVYGLECRGEVIDGDVHVLQLLAELLPLVIPESSEVEVDQLGGEPGELVVQTHAVVTTLRAVLLILTAGLPRVRVYNLRGRIPYCHPDGAVSALEDLVGHVERGPRVDVLPVAVLLPGLNVHLVLHRDTWS